MLPSPQIRGNQLQNKPYIYIFQNKQTNNELNQPIDRSIYISYATIFPVVIRYVTRQLFYKN